MQQLISSRQTVQLTTRQPGNSYVEFAPTYKQKENYSCGAACLFFISRNWGLAKTPDLANTLRALPALADTYPYFDDREELRSCDESDIYNLTKSPNGFSLLENMVRTAKLLGMTAKVYFPPEVAGRLDAYPVEFSPSLIANTVKELQLLDALNECNQPELQTDEMGIKLCIVTERGATICPHYVVVRPDGSLMDPAMGINCKNFDEKNSCCEKHLIDTGISIVLKNEERPPSLDSAIYGYGRG